MTFQPLIADCSMSDCLDALYSSILSFIPKVFVRPFNFPSWFTPDLIKLVHNKNRAHARHKYSQSLTDYWAGNYSRLRDG